MKSFLLLDIDGVLLKAGGYRRSFVDTANHFLSEMGQEHLSVNDRMAETFELYGIRCEWDMAPLILAAFFEWYAANSGWKGSFGADALHRCLPPYGKQAEFETAMLKQIDVFSHFPVNDADLAVLICNACREQKERGPLPHLGADPVLPALLYGSLDPHCSEIFRWLAALVLGSETFSSFFGIPAPVETSSYLMEKDTPLISKAWRERLRQEAGEECFPCVMTYRPTRIPRSASWKPEDDYLHTPEGECAMRMLEWDDGRVRMIGGGDIFYLEQRSGVKRDTFAKPHPIHALAGLLDTLCRDEKLAVELAKKLWDLDQAGSYEVNPAAELLRTDEALRVAVFEDSMAGILSCKDMVNLLCRFGYHVEMYLYGILTTPEKSLAMQKIGAKMMCDINQALADYLR